MTTETATTTTPKARKLGDAIYVLDDMLYGAHAAMYGPFLARVDYLPAGAGYDPAFFLALPEPNFETTIVTISQHIRLEDVLSAVEARPDWRVGARRSDEGGPNRAWVTVYGPDNRTAHIGIHAAMADDPLLPPRISAQQAHHRLEGWRIDFGVHYRYTPGVALLAAIRRSIRHASPDMIVRHRGVGGQVEAWPPPAPLEAIRWQGRAGRGHSARVRLHRWDMRKAYLAAAAAAEIPHGRLHHSGTDPLSRVGYFRVRADQIDPGHRLFLPKPDRQNTIWVGGATLGVLGDARPQPEIIDSWTSTLHTRLLRSWAERIRNTLANADDYLAPIVKTGYAQAIGLMAVHSGSVYRPDWRHLIIDQTNSSMIRRIYRVARLMNGLLPAKVDIDSVWYRTDDPEHVGMALGVGPNMGNMRYEGEATL